MLGSSLSLNGIAALVQGKCPGKGCALRAILLPRTQHAAN